MNEIDEAIQVARDAADRDLARYRIGLIVVSIVLTGGLQLVRVAAGRPYSWASPIYFAAALVYAVGVARATRQGRHAWIIPVTIVLDPFVLIGNLPMMVAI